MRKTIAPTIWTDEMDNALRSMWFKLSIVRCADAIGITVDRVRNRASRIGLPDRKSKEFRAGIRELWISEAQKAADIKNVGIKDVLSGVRRPEVVEARWLAWSNAVGSEDCLSTSLLATVSGFDHSSILYGIARLRGQSAKYLHLGSLAYPRALAKDPDGIRSIGEVIEQHLHEIVGVDA